MAKKFFIIITIFYCLCMIVYLFSSPIANFLVGHDPQEVDGGLTYLEYMNSLKAEKLSQNIYIYFLKISIIMCIIFGLFRYFNPLVKGLLMSKVIFYISLFWSVFLLFAYSIGFIGRGYIT